MKISCFKLLFPALCFCFLSHQGYTQNRFKAGLGATLVSNAGNHPAFNAFVATSLHLGYALALSPKLKLGLENYLAVRLKEKESRRQEGFAVGLPVALEYRLPKVSFYTGAGPAYASQAVRNDGVWGTDRIRSTYADVMIGAGFRKRRVAQYFETELNLRFHYLKNVSSTKEDGAMLSFFITVRGADGNK